MDMMDNNMIGFCIYIGQGLYYDYDAGIVKEPFVFNNMEAARKAMKSAILNFSQRGDIIHAAYKPAIRRLKSLSPVIFEPDQKQGEQTKLFNNQTNLF